MRAELENITLVHVAIVHLFMSDSIDVSISLMLFTSSPCPLLKLSASGRVNVSVVLSHRVAWLTRSAPNRTESVKSKSNYKKSIIW